MKNNNKNRKLNFIRAKNGLRNGTNSFYQLGKISNLLLNSDLSKGVIESLVDTAKKKCLNYWKLNIPFKTIDFEYKNDDFVKDIKSFKITLEK